MLSAELINFQNKLKDIINKSSSTAAEEAFKETVNKTNNSTIDDFVQKEIDDIAKRFGKKFGDVFSKEISADLAKEIMLYIQKSEIMITCMPQALATIVSPMGPCTGSLLINKGTANIQIL